MRYGFDLAVSGRGGRPTGYSYLAQELASLARSGGFDNRPVLDDADVYCDAVVDLSAFMGSGGSDRSAAREVTESVEPESTTPHSETIHWVPGGDSKRTES